ncbi:hypothetical protein, partial [Nonomuraea zeae]
MGTWPFAGREEELGHLLRLCCDPTAQGVLVAGPPGVGTSRLAGRLAARFARVVVVRAARPVGLVPGGALAALLPSLHAGGTVERHAGELLRQAGRAYPPPPSRGDLPSVLREDSFHANGGPPPDAGPHMNHGSPTGHGGHVDDGLPAGDGLPVDCAPVDWAPECAPTDWAPADWAQADCAPADGEPARWEPADWGPVDWGPVDWGPVDWGPADWGPADWGSVGSELLLDEVVLVDDAHLLDRHSAEVIASLVLDRRARLIATVCSGCEAAAGPVAGLWRDGLVRRFDVEPFRGGDLAAVLAAALRGPVGEDTVARLCEITGGNALWLREVVTAARASGALQPVGGVWRLSGDPPAASGLEDLIGARVGALPGPAAEVLEYVALGEPVGVRTLAALCSEAAVREAAALELITVAAEGRREVVRPMHPLYGDVARERCPELRRRDRYADLAAVVEAHGTRRGDDVARIIGWRLAGGLEADPEPLAGACRLAGAVHDHRAAIRLGRAAVQAGGGAGAAIELASALDDAGHPDQAHTVLSDAERLVPEPGGEHARARLAGAMAGNLAWGLDRLGDALDLLARTAREVTNAALRHDLDVRRATLLAAAARTHEALTLTADLLSRAERAADPSSGDTSDRLQHPRPDDAPQRRTDDATERRTDTMKCRADATERRADAAGHHADAAGRRAERVGRRADRMERRADAVDCQADEVEHLAYTVTHRAGLARPGPGEEPEPGAG